MPSPTFSSKALLLASLLSSTSCGCPTAGRLGSGRGRTPNILFFSLDTLRADVLGCYGGTSGASPTLDRLAAEGLRFDRAFTVTPLTIPAHASLFTGLLPPRHGVRDNGDFFLGDAALTLAERLRDGGYATMASVGAEVTSHHWGFDQGFEAFFDTMQRSEEQRNRWRVERRADAVLEDALGWFEQAPDDRPYFAWIHLFDVHHPYAAPDPYGERYAQRPYLGEVAWVDAEVQRLLGRLESMGRLENTWIVVVGDHGESLGAHGESMHGVLLYNETTRVPFIVRPPTGVGVRGKVITAPVSLVDVTPTILSLAGVTSAGPFDGLDLAPVLRGEDSAKVIPEDRGVFIESLYAWRHYGWAPQTALATADYKLIDSTTPELYVWSDREEASNLAPADAGRLSGLRARLHEWKDTLEQVGEIKGRVELSPDRLSQLEALGYITNVVEPGAPGEGLPDPVQHLPVLRDVEKARQALQKGETDTARALIEEVITREPGLIEPQTMLIQILSRAGHREEALERAQALAASHPSSGLKSLMGILHMERGEFELAAHLLGEALEMDPYLTQSWAPFLHAIYVMGDIQRLEREVERGRRLLPDSAVIQGMEGVVLVLKHDFAAAEPLLKDAMTRAPDTPLLNMGLADIARTRGDDNRAESHYLEEVRMYPRAVQARRALVEIYAGQKRYTEQFEQLEAIVGMEPPNPFTAHSRAQVLFNMRRFPEALIDVERCVTLAPKYPACAMLKANTLKKLGREKEALQAYHHALKLGEEYKESRATAPKGGLAGHSSAPAPTLKK